MSDAAKDTLMYMHADVDGSQLDRVPKNEAERRLLGKRELEFKFLITSIYFIYQRIEVSRC